jgi:hypothetical protein
MIKRAILALALAASATIAHAAGTVPGFSLAPQFDNAAKVMPGCKLYVYQAGTVATPQNSYQDTGLTTAQPNPLTCDAAGRLPQWFVADGLIKLRLTDKNGNQVFVGDNLLVVGPSSGGGGGGGGTIDATTIFQTGDVKQVYGSGSIVGWVRMNGRTIGSATSGASERANADTQALFTLLWNNDAGLAVSGGRGVSAAADWTANKTIALPDARGRPIAGLLDMGNTTSSILDPTFAGCGVTNLGSLCGSQSHTLTAGEIPQITSNGNNNITVYLGGNTSNNVPFTTGTIQAQNQPAFSAGANLPWVANGNPWNGGNTFSGTNGISVTSNNAGGGAHSIVSPIMLATIYIKL